MEESATITPVSNLVTMPTNWLSVRNVKIDGNPVTTLQYITPAEMDRLDTNNAGNYTIVGDQIKLDGTPGDVVVEYYLKIPALTDVATTNWLLETNPDVYLYGCLAEVFKFAMDEAEATKYTALFMNGVQEIRNLDRKRKYAQNLRVRVA
jgi:hypothetical protein